MAEQTFADFIARDRERLHAEREQIFNQQQELEGKLADINRELSAIDAYEAAKTGKARKHQVKSGEVFTPGLPQGYPRVTPHRQIRSKLRLT